MAVFSFGGKDFASKIPFFQISVFCKIQFGKTASKRQITVQDLQQVFSMVFTMRNGLYGSYGKSCSGGIWQGALYMALFGLGTLPFMFAIVLAEIS
jgi:hypothetical protein